MGLLLSVLVVCVGVLEVIACVRHFQDGYLPLWTPHCAVTSGFAITHDRWRKLPSFDYAKNDDEKCFEDLTGAKNGAVTLGLQDDSVESVEKFGKTLHCAASLQDDQKVVSEVNLEESEPTFVAKKLSDNQVSANEPEDKIVNSDIHKQTVTDVFQSDIYNNNLVQTEHNLEADNTTFHTQNSNLTSDQHIQTKHEAEFIQELPEDIPDDSLKHVEEHEDNDSYETTVVDTLRHEETTSHITKDNSSESDSRLEPQTSSSDAEVIRSADTETQPQDAEVKSEQTPEELIETLKKTPSPVRFSPPISTPPLTPKKSKADISWPTFFPGAPVIKRPSVSFATPEALLAGEDPEPRPRNEEEERPATPPPIIKRSKENTPVPSDLESRSMSSESLGEDVDQEEEDNEEQNLFSGIREKSPTSIISGNDFSKKELELQRRKSYKLKRFNSAVETVSRDEQAEDRSFSEDKKGMSHAIKSREPKRKLKKPVKATSFEDAMLRDISDGDVVDAGTTLKLGKEVKFVHEPAVVAEEEEILLEQEAQTPQEESKRKTDEGLKVSFGQVESEPEKYVVHEEEKQFEKNYSTEQKEPVISEQRIVDESESIQVPRDERLKEGLNEQQCSAVTKPADENQDVAGLTNQSKHEKVPHEATQTESGPQSNKDDIHQQLMGENTTGMQNVCQIHSKSIEVKSGEELTTKIDSKQSKESKDDIPNSKEVETFKDNSEMHSKSTQSKSSAESTTKFDSRQNEEKLKDKQVPKEEEEEEEEEIVEWIEEEVVLDNSEFPSKAMEINKSSEISIKLDSIQNEEKGQTKLIVGEEQEEEEDEVEGEEEEMEEEEEEAMIVDNSKVHSKAMEIKSSDETATKTDTKQDEEKGESNQPVTKEMEEEEEEEEELVVEEEEEEALEEQAVVLDKSNVHCKAIEIKSSDEMSTKTDTKQDETKSETKQADAEEEEDVVMVDNSEVHSKVVEIKASDEKVVIDTSKVHSKSTETKSSDETTTQVLAKEGEEEEGLRIEEKSSATKVSDEQEKSLTREEKSSATEVSAEGEKSLTREEKSSAAKVSDEQEKSLTREEKSSAVKVSDEGQHQRQSSVVERSTKVVEGEEEEEDSSSYTFSESTQQKTPPKEAFWME